MFALYRIAGSVPTPHPLLTAMYGRIPRPSQRKAATLTHTDRPHTANVEIHKFGGTSVGDAARIRHAAELVARSPGRPVVVVSAVAGVTDRLERLPDLARQGETGAWREEVRKLAAFHRELLGGLLPADASGRPEARRVAGILSGIRDRLALLEEADEGSRSLAPDDDPAWVDQEIQAAGEDLSVILLAAALRAQGVPGRETDARTLIRTEARRGTAVPRDEETVRLVRDRLLPMLERGEVPVIQGFIGATQDGRTTTLGRGGSDFTAAIVGAALGAKEVTIWTDVAGIHSADPRVVPAARVLPELGFEEAVELAWFGARVIHPAAAKHAAAREVALRIRSSLDPEAEGTLIRSDRREGPAVAAVAHRAGVTLITVRSRPLFMAHGFLARVFHILARHAVPVDLVATSHTSTAFTLDRREELTAVREELEQFAEVTVRERLATVTVVGRGLLGRPGITGAIFRTLGDRPVNLISQASDVSLSFLVDEEGAAKVVEGVHRELIEGGGTE